VRALLQIALALGVASAALDESPAPERMRGVSWEAGGHLDGAALDPLPRLGVDWISQTPFGWCRSLQAPEVRLASGAWLPWGESDEGLVETARLARARGIKTLLKPQLWVRGGRWVGELEMTSEPEWQAWFASYTAFILHYAELAERASMEALAIGTELRKTSSHTADWLRLIAKVRNGYHGRLSYCANWQEAEDVGFWAALDFVGVQAYYPLPVTGPPTLAAIRAAWKPALGRLDALAARTGKPIVFTEVGYRSLTGSLAEPWLWSTDGTTDLALQRDAYAAMFESVWERAWFGGAFVWKWQPRLGTPQTPAPRTENDFTPQGKPALEVMRAFYLRRDPSLRR
jgi:hypothetical protein